MRSSDKERMKALGMRIAELREMRGWSQTELGRRLYDGLPAVTYQTTIQTMVSRTEKGERSLGVFEALELAEIFGITVAELVSREPIEQDPTAGLREAIAVLQAEVGRMGSK